MNCFSFWAKNWSKNVGVKENFSLFFFPPPFSFISQTNITLKHICRYTAEWDWLKSTRLLPKLQNIKPISQFGLWILKSFDSQQVQKFIKSTRDDIKTKKAWQREANSCSQKLYNSAFTKIGLNLCGFRWHVWKQLPSQWPATLAFHISSLLVTSEEHSSLVWSPLKWIATPNLVFHWSTRHWPHMKTTL